MPASGSFLDSSIQIQKETEWGTAVTSGMTRIPTLTWDMNPAYDTFASQMITGAAGAPAPVFGVKRVTGRWTLEAGYAGGFDHILYGVLGSATNVVTSNPFTNRYTPSASLPSFTVHASYGDLLADKVIEFQGVKFNAVEFSGDVSQGFMNISCDLIGEDANHNTTSGVAEVAPTTTVTHDPVQLATPSHVSVFNLGVGSYATYCVRSFNIRVERFLSTSGICLGASTISEPVCDRPMAVTLQFNVEHEDFALYNALTAKTVHTSTQIKFTSGAGRVVDFVFPKVVYTQISTPIQQGDKLITSVTGIAYGTAGTGATSEPMNVTVEGPLDSDLL